MKKALVLVALFALSGCGCPTPACRTFNTSDHDAAACAAEVDNHLQNVKCYDATGKVIVDSNTMGVMSYQGGEMVFRDIATHQVVRATGTCVARDVE